MNSITCAPFLLGAPSRSVFQYRGIGGVRPTVERLIALAGRRSSVVVAATTAGADYLASIGIASAKILVIPNAVDGGASRVMADEAAGVVYALPSSRFIVAVVARAVPYKGQMDALRALSLIPPSVRPFLWLVAPGEHPDNDSFRAELRVAIQDLQLADDVILRSEPVDVCRAMSAIDLVWVPSHLESFGRVAVEAGLSRTPVVASVAGGLTEVLPPGTPFFATGDAAGLARLTTELMADASALSQITRLQHAAARRFSPATVAGHFLEVYRAVMEQP